jgi:TetR/AcrR family transcriptional repressor of nem operon
MSRASQAQARENRQRVVETAARLFRERGVAQVSVADVMAGAGLAHDMPGADADLAATYAAGVESYADKLGGTAAVSTAVGALILARATAGTELSDRILAEALASLEASR